MLIKLPSTALSVSPWLSDLGAFNHHGDTESTEGCTKKNLNQDRGWRRLFAVDT